MAVQNSNKAGMKQPTQAGQQDQAQQPQGFGGMPNFGINSRLSSFGSGGEAFEKLYESIQKRIKMLNEEGKTEEVFSATKLLKQVAGLNYSGIVIAQTVSDVTSAHILMVEKTGDYPEKLVETIGNVRYELTRTPADALDDSYVAQAQIAVGAALGIDASSVIITDGTLVPNEFDMNSEAQIEELVRNAFNAVHSENCIRTKDYKGISLPALMKESPNGKFYVSMYFNGDRSSFLDQSGMPVRQDICIGLTFKTGTNNTNKSVNQGNDQVDIVKTYGYIDFEWAGAPAHGMPSTQRFMPNFIITHIESQFAPTPDIMMLGVASVLAINEELNWMQAFRATPGRKNEIDYNDIGALNIEGNLEGSPTGYGKLYDTKAKTFALIELNKLVQTLVTGNMMVSMDLPKAGPETWYTSVFHYIKFRSNKAAYMRVMDSVSTLTNGAFQHNNVPMFTGVTNKIHGGFYRTKDGFEDIRHLTSYLSVANFVAATNQAPAILSQYTNTLYNSTIPTELRAAERKKIIDEMSGNTAVYKQYYDRVTFNASFLGALVGSLRMAGFAPLFNNMGVSNDMFLRRSTADFGSALVGPDLRLMGQNNIYGNFSGMGGYTRTY